MNKMRIEDKERKETHQKTMEARWSMHRNLDSDLSNANYAKSDDGENEEESGSQPGSYRGASGAPRRGRGRGARNYHSG